MDGTSVEWIDDKVFMDEAIGRHRRKSSVPLPSLLKKARKLEATSKWSPIDAMFLKQGRLLANYEDDFPYSGDPGRFYPTYQTLSDKELRGYFSWRSKIRKGIYAPGPVSFQLLHIYEIINNIGIPSPAQGYERLLALQAHYPEQSQYIDDRLSGWLRDYVIYYGLDPALVADMPAAAQNAHIAVLKNIYNEPMERVIEALRQLAPKWLGRSRFYATHTLEMNKVIYAVLKRMTAHYANCTKPFVEQFFGSSGFRYTRLFAGALFADPLKRKKYEYRVNGQTVYKYEKGSWSVERYLVTPRGVRKIEDILKTIDAAMREAFNAGHAIQSPLATKWILRVIREEIEKLQQEISASKVVPIDLSRLRQIRRDADITRDKLNVPEAEETEPRRPEPLAAPPAASPAAPPATPAATPSGLTEAECRLVRTLLQGEDIAWVRQEGYILSVLVDGINDKLYDLVGDTVLDETPSLIPDYISQVKEIISA